MADEEAPTGGGEDGVEFVRVRQPPTLVLIPWLPHTPDLSHMIAGGDGVEVCQGAPLPWAAPSPRPKPDIVGGDGVDFVGVRVASGCPTSWHGGKRNRGMV